MSAWPVDRPGNWLQQVNRRQTAAEDAAIQLSMTRGQPLGEPA